MLTMDIMRNIPEVCNNKTPSFEARCSAYVASNGSLESSVIETLHYLSATDFQQPYITRGHQLVSPARALLYVLAASNFFYPIE